MIVKDDYENHGCHGWCDYDYHPYYYCSYPSAYCYYGCYDVGYWASERVLLAPKRSQRPQASGARFKEATIDLTAVLDPEP